MLPASPRLDPEAWAGVELATKKRTFVHPALPGQGGSTVEARSSQTIDQAKAAGRDKATTKLAGLKPIPVTMNLTFTAKCFDAAGGVREMLEAIQPDGEEGGGPFEVKAADVNWRRVKAVTIEELGSIKWRGEFGTVDIKSIQWVPKGEAGKGASGTKTPDSAAQYRGPDPFNVAEGRVSDDGGKTTVLVARKGIKGFADSLKTPSVKPPGNVATGKVT